jgi:hypothetical protein
MSICKASEIPRNEAYIEVRRSDEGWICLFITETKDLSNSIFGCECEGLL